MRTILHILTQEDDADAGAVISRQRALPENKLETVCVASGQPDYAALLVKIFAADSVAVW